MPFYTRCIQPHSTDPRLFTNREEEYHHIKEILRSIIIAKGQPERRLLIHGERGVGKSILLRKVLAHLSQEIDFIPVFLDGRNSKDAEELLRDACEQLASLLSDEDEYKKDTKAITEITYMGEISRVAEITKNWANSVTKEIEVKSGAGIGFLNFLKLKLGAGVSETDVERLNETITIEINSRLLRELLNHVIEKIEKEVVFAIDNLDQIHDKAQTAEFVREIFRHRESPIIATLRSEAITVEFRRSFRDSVLIGGLSQGALMDILDKRMEGCKERSILGEKLTNIASKLKTVTDNPLSFLTWIHYLCNYTELNAETLVESLKRFISASYGFDPDRASSIGKFFLDRDNQFLTKEEILTQSRISEDDCKEMIEHGILIPDNLYEPRRYRLSSDLEFLRLMQER